MALPAEDILKTLPPEERAAIEKRSAELLAECQNPPAGHRTNSHGQVRACAIVHMRAFPKARMPARCRRAGAAEPEDQLQTPRPLPVAVRRDLPRRSNAGAR